MWQQMSEKRCLGYVVKLLAMTDFDRYLAGRRNVKFQFRGRDSTFLKNGISLPWNLLNGN